MKRTCIIFYIFFSVISVYAQNTPFILKGALKENRQQSYRKLVNNVILKNISSPVTEATESLWSQAITAIELLQYHSAFTDNKISAAFDHLEQYSPEFQQQLIELAYTLYPHTFVPQVTSIMNNTHSSKLFAIAAVYILQSGERYLTELLDKAKHRSLNDTSDAILHQLVYHLEQTGKKLIVPSLKPLFKKDFLPGHVIVFSVQRKNRDFPGLVIVRDTQGNFIMENEQLFTVPQLARSLNNLPSFLTNGNTPQGIYRMDRFDTSASSFIGPTPNIQLTMPFEFKPSHFYDSPTLPDSSWEIERYLSLLPPALQQYIPLRESYYAGKAGRTEIIAHGTTIDPGYYRAKPFYPIVPTQGCLATKEIWNDENGRLIYSDQQKLIDAVQLAGGPNGYSIVIDINDKQAPVTPEELAELLPARKQ